jgi:gamma-glutamylcyclotransferase (GGCT)/AIG2-like uncharacterized protein YtfP
LRLFVYGTLIDESRLEALTGRRFPRRPATLDGFARRALPAGHPTVERRADARVDGFLVEDVDAASLAALDRYEDEGRLYRRCPVEVIVDGARVACEVYVAITPSPAPAPGRARRRASGA